MILKLITAGIFTAAFLVDGTSAENSPPATSFPDPDAFISPDKYPNPRRDESVKDTYANTVVIYDPYRWIEKTDSPEAQKFIADEMALTTPYLEKSPFRKELLNRFKELWNYPKYIGPMQIGKKFFSYRNTGLQNKDVLYIHDAPNDEGTVFFDPNTLSQDGSGEVDADYFSFSDDGSVFAYLTSDSGSDWNDLHFKNVDKPDTYKEKLTNIKYSVPVWTKDNKGVFFQAIPGDRTSATDKNPKIFYHILGTEQSKDVVAVEFPEHPDLYMDISITDCGKYLIVRLLQGISNNLVYVADLDKIKYDIKGKLELIPLVTKMEANYYFFTNIETQLIFKTNKGADNYKLVSVDFTKPDSWKDLVPEDEKKSLEWAAVAWDKYFVVCYIEDVKSVLQLHEAATGKMVKKFDLEAGTVQPDSFFSGKKYKDIYFNFESFLTPGIIYHCDLSKPSFDLEIFKEIHLTNFDRTKYTSEQIFFNSKDGTRVPMYCVYKKGFQKNGNNLAFLFGYGGYGVSLLPYFTVNRIVVVDNLDGVHCAANIRGGGEYGEKWHREGSLDKKQNSFDDFQAAAEYLIKEKFTNNKLLSINGSSNGGTLVLACLNQRPDLFGVVVADVPGCDMLRYDQFTSGKASITEYGTATNAEDFRYLIKYSPLHNIKITDDKQYPATMLITADHDERILPHEPLKFIATAQFEAKKHTNQKNPLIIRVRKGSGHDNANLDQEIAEYVDRICFIVMNTGIKFHT